MEKLIHNITRADWFCKHRVYGLRYKAIEHQDLLWLAWCKQRDGQQYATRDLYNFSDHHLLAEMPDQHKIGIAATYLSRACVWKD